MSFPTGDAHAAQSTRSALDARLRSRIKRFNSATRPTYTEHNAAKPAGILVIDATLSGNGQPVRNLIWVGINGVHGRWLNEGQAHEVKWALLRTLSLRQARMQRELDGLRA
ncbi:hypothetical protein [Xylophilus ampelinus]|uniref:Uncharacterized protein n=1 Tax=Xylophilus ampelinus TaxID=54067 RepID=A0A318SL27_9BURK|nr:hypothetical protein [Xylophilus ampelinus]MCS4509161.1 hypothetical protein [Xylophilus ampelinus]PYE79813.1 hypothetical protein DFQ15_101133 [Xylophilus ampelinus]